MFLRSQDVIKGVLNGLISSQELPQNKQNEMFKSWLFKDQAQMNIDLSAHVPICRALGYECMKEECVFFKNNIAGSEEKWVCGEFQIDYPSASFDSRVHITFIGEDTIDMDKTREHLLYLMLQGARFICTGCKCVYQNIPQSITGYDQFAKPLYNNLCDCGSEIFEPLDHFIDSNF